MKKTKSRKVTAAELMAKLNADPAFVARQARQEEEHQKRVARLREVEAPLVEELRAVGCAVDSVWDLIPKYSRTKKVLAPYPQALPILLEHLLKPYPGAVREGIARALGVPNARFAWPSLIQQYLVEQDPRTKDGLAVALAGVAGDDQLEDIIALAMDTLQGPSRVLLLEVLERSKEPRGQAALVGLRNDPELREEIQKYLRRHGIL
jgi:hypothetical protein